jgi:single-strand DNA-binding protein
MNKITCLGNLGRDAEVRMVPRASGAIPVVNFSIAVKIGYGESETTEWRDCSWWGERAQKCSRWLTKGKQLLIVGEPTIRTFEKKDRTMGSVMSIRVDEVHFVGGKPGEASASAPAEDTETKTILNAPPASTEDVPY